MYLSKLLGATGGFPGLGLILTMLLAGCGQVTPTATQTRIERGLLTPYRTATPATAPAAQPENSTPDNTATALPSPTPTPVVYTIVENDTLTGIANRHGLSLDQIIAANPGIDPNFLTIGMTLTIPIAEQAGGSLPGPTPIPIRLQGPKCYLTAEGGLWCLALAKNSQPYDVENVAADFHLRTEAGEPIASQAALPLLNLLRSGDAIPLGAYFPPDIPPEYQPQVELRSVLPADSAPGRYLAFSTTITENTIADTKKQARVTGTVSLIDDERPGEEIWLVAVAYDQDEHPIGFRKWTKTAPLPPGESAPFEITVFSLGPDIERVEILGEIRP